MVRLTHLLYGAVTFLASTAAASSVVIDLDSSNFDDIVLKSGKPALVEFFAPWCGHCKNLAPTYEELATVFAGQGNKVTIAKVDADNHRDLGKRFGVQGFPTLKWFDGKSATPSDYNGGRDLESLTAFVTENSGVKTKAKKADPSNVEVLTDSSFKEIIGSDKDVLVAFTAPWCGHCKKLAPTWETVANDFVNEPGVIVAKVDAEAENSKATSQSQGVSSYPTLLFYPKGSTTGIPYQGHRNEGDFVEFLNEKTGTHRAIGGGLDANGGTVAVLDALVAKYVAGDLTLAAVTKEITSASADLKDTYAVYYGKVLAKLSQSSEYVIKESARLQKIIKKGGLAPEKLDDLVSRSNVLSRFLGQEEGKSEL